MKTAGTLVCLTLAIAAGCGRSKPTEDEPRPSDTRPTRSDKEREFREKVAHYLAEVKAGAKLYDIFPTRAEAKAKSEHIRDLYSRLPDVPPGIDQAERIGGRLKNISAGFVVAEALLNRLGSNPGGAEIEAVATGTRDIMKTTLEYVAEVETLLGK